MREWLLVGTLLLVGLLLIASSGCAMRMTIQGCSMRCPDAMKTPAQIEAELKRDQCIESNNNEDCEQEESEE